LHSVSFVSRVVLSFIMILFECFYRNHNAIMFRIACSLWYHWNEWLNHGQWLKTQKPIHWDFYAVNKCYLSLLVNTFYNICHDMLLILYVHDVFNESTSIWHAFPYTCIRQFTKNFLFPNDLYAFFSEKSLRFVLKTWCLNEIIQSSIENNKRVKTIYIFLRQIQNGRDYFFKKKQQWPKCEYSVFIFYLLGCFFYFLFYTFIVITAVKFSIVKHERVHSNARTHGICSRTFVVQNVPKDTCIYKYIYIYIFLLHFWPGSSCAANKRDAHYWLAGTTRLQMCIYVRERFSPENFITYDFKYSHRLPNPAPAQFR